jgi:hypothetical protein
MSYVIKNFKSAPPLTALHDYTPIKYDKNDNEFVELMIYYNEQQSLDRYLGNFIIKRYKKDDPTQQSLWNSDTSRLNYVIKELLANKLTGWNIDKKGIKTKKCIIEPLIDFIKPLVMEYIVDLNDSIVKLDTQHEMIQIIPKLKGANELLTVINNKTLENDVIAYISPYFYLNKTDDMVIL